MNKLKLLLQTYSKPFIIDILVPFVLGKLTDDEIDRLEGDISFERRKREWDKQESVDTTPKE